MTGGHHALSRLRLQLGASLSWGTQKWEGQFGPISGVALKRPELQACLSTCTIRLASVFTKCWLRTDSNENITLDLLEASPHTRDTFPGTICQTGKLRPPMISRNYLVTLDGLLSRDRMDLGTCVLSGPRPFGPPKDTGPFRP